MVPPPVEVLLLMAKPFSLAFPPGIARDGTLFDSKEYADALWCRWRLGKPRKIGGFQTISNTLNGLPRKVHCFYNNAQIIAHVGTNAGIQQIIFDTNGTLLGISDRTPPTFLGGPNTALTLDAIFDTTSSVVQLVAHVTQNNGFIANATKTTPFIGQIDGAAPLAEFSTGSPPTGVWTKPAYAGGIVCVQPFVFGFDIDGLVQWSAPNLPLYLGTVGGSTLAGQARISAQKIIAGAPLRGGGSQSPAAVFWSMSEVIVATFIGGTPVFSFSTVSPSSSILSTGCVIEYDGLYFWAGVDRFLVFNGTVTEVPNNFNQDWFFDNLTPGYESQTWGFKVPRYGEIWWCACMFGSTVPNYAIIFNLREKAWYDTLLPTSTWSAGYAAQGFKRPIVAGMDGANTFKLWMGETGTDNVDGLTRSAIRSYFETSYFGGPRLDPPDDAALAIHQLEPDFEQSGDLITYLIGAPNARSAESSGPQVPILQAPGVPQEQFASYTPTQSQRLTRLHVESNVVGGNYVTGRNLMRADVAERRLVG